MERKNKSPVWRVFIKDAAHKRTVCTQCGKEFKYRYTTTNLRDHLKRYHPEWLPESGVNSTVELVVPYTDKSNVSVEVRNNSCLDSAISDELEPVRKNKSAVWQVFTKDAESKNVTCAICHKEFKFWNNTTNLRAHLRRSHPEWRPETTQSFNESGEEIDYDEQDDIEGRRSSASSTCSINAANADTLPSDSFVWRVFVKGDPGKGVFCTLCQKDFPSLNKTWSMIDHLRRLHPDWEQPPDTLVTKVAVTDDEAEKEQSNELASKSLCLMGSDRKNRSPVWDVFVKDSIRKRTVCSICKKDFKCWNNTANLLDHLRRIHPDWKPGSAGYLDLTFDDSTRKRPTIARITNLASGENSELKPSLQYIESSFSTMEPSSEIKAKKVDSLIGEMICMDFQSLSIVDDVGFKKLMNELLPNYKLPSRKIIVKHTLPELYDNVCKQIEQRLRKCKYVAVSVELWTNQALEGFMTLTVHYFANDTYTSSVLQTERINTEHSSEDLASVMHRIFDHWKIFEKITAIVADDDGALKAACDLLNIIHIPCIAQLINNIITEELTENDDAQHLLQRCLNLVAHFKLNPSATDILHDIQQQMGHPVLNLKQVAPTRWNSALHMAQRLVDMKEPLLTTLGAIHEGPEPVTTNEWLNLEDFITVLKPFESITSEFSADSYCNISKVVPLVRGVQSSLQNATCVSDLGAAMKKSLLEKLETRFSLYEKCMIPSVATLLDPRFKTIGLGVETAIQAARTFVTEQLCEMKNNAYKEKDEKEKSEEKNANSDIWNFLDEKVNEITSQEPPVSYAEKTVTQYLELPYLKRQTDCPFKFWICQANLEPELADLAMKFMCIPATSFPAERMYSKTGITVMERRNKMATKHFDTIIFLNKNL